MYVLDIISHENRNACMMKLNMISGLFWKKSVILLPDFPSDGLHPLSRPFDSSLFAHLVHLIIPFPLFAMSFPVPPDG